jgi:hypothetical protein
MNTQVLHASVFRASKHAAIVYVGLRPEANQDDRHMTARLELPPESTVFFFLAERARLNDKPPFIFQ